MSDELRIIAYKAETVLRELADLTQNGPFLRAYHRFWIKGTQCMAGEEVWAIVLVSRGREFRLPLSLALRLLLNYLADTRHIPQSATQIVAGLHRSAFYIKHGMNSGVASRRKITRSAIKEYVKRLRLALGAAFRDAAIDLNVEDVLVSRKTMGNEVQYQLRAGVECVHIAGNHLSL